MIKLYMLIFTYFLYVMSVNPQIHQKTHFEDSEDSTLARILVEFLVVPHFQQCFLVLITPVGSDRSSGSHNVLFGLLERLFSQQYLAYTIIHLKGSSNLVLTHSMEHNFGCRLTIIDVRQNAQLHLVLKFLEVEKVYKFPENKLLFLGNENDEFLIWQNYWLRNTIHLFYAVTTQYKATNSSETLPDYKLRGRCLYCKNGRPHLKLLDHLNKGLNQAALNFLSNDLFSNFYGHHFQVTSMDWFPFVAFNKTNEEPCSEVILLDSLDFRMLNTLSHIHNFTYTLRTPCDEEWGRSTSSGNWTGTVGTLQHHMTDFSLMLSLLPKRRLVIDYSRPYTSEPIVMAMIKPGMLPHSFALVRPFSNGVWLAILSSVAVATASMWLFQQMRAKLIGGGKVYSLLDTFQHIWSILLEEPPKRLLPSITDQMIFAWWWIYCMLIVITYRSSLMAHLTIPSKSTSIETVQQLVNGKNYWTWGLEPNYGSGYEYLKSSQNPNIKILYQEMKVEELDKQIQMMFESHHVFLSWKYYFKSIVANHFTNDMGYTSIRIAQEELFTYGGYGWGFRQGAPFRRTFGKSHQHLIEAGLVTKWLDDLIQVSAIKAKKERENIPKQERRFGHLKFSLHQQLQDGVALVVLSLDHLQGVFYSLFLGYAVSLTIFTIEIIKGTCWRHRFD